MPFTAPDAREGPMGRLTAKHTVARATLAANHLWRSPMLHMCSGPAAAVCWAVSQERIEFNEGPQSERCQTLLGVGPTA